MSTHSDNRRKAQVLRLHRILKNNISFFHVKLLKADLFFMYRKPSVLILSPMLIRLTDALLYIASFLAVYTHTNMPLLKILELPFSFCSNRLELCRVRISWIVKAYIGGVLLQSVILAHTCQAVWNLFCKSSIKE